MHKTTVVVDHDAARILGVVVAEIRPGPAMISRRQADAFLQCINTTSTAQPERKAALVREFRRAPPEAQDRFHGLFFGSGGSIEHLAGVKCPVVRLGHPARSEIFRLNLIQQPGTVIGQVKNGRLEGGQLRADIHLLAAAPIADWDAVRCTLLSLAARHPDSMGVSVAVMPEPAVLPVACDLVAHPSNRNGLLGYPPASIESIGCSRVSSELVFHEALVYAWLDGSTRGALGDERDDGDRQHPEIEREPPPAA